LVKKIDKGKNQIFDLIQNSLLKNPEIQINKKNLIPKRKSIDKNSSINTNSSNSKEDLRKKGSFSVKKKNITGNYTEKKEKNNFYVQSNNNSRELINKKEDMIIKSSNYSNNNDYIKSSKIKGLSENSDIYYYKNINSKLNIKNEINYEKDNDYDYENINNQNQKNKSLKITEDDFNYEYNNDDYYDNNNYYNSKTDFINEQSSQIVSFLQNKIQTKKSFDPLTSIEEIDEKHLQLGTEENAKSIKELNNNKENNIINEKSKIINVSNFVLNLNQKASPNFSSGFTLNMIGNNGSNNVSPLRKTYKNEFDFEDRYMNMKENRYINNNFWNSRENEVNKNIVDREKYDMKSNTSNNNFNEMNMESNTNVLKGSLTSFINIDNISNINKENNNTLLRASFTSLNNISINKDCSSPENINHKTKVNFNK
jgi:hypothetical protein